MTISKSDADEISRQINDAISSVCIKHNLVFEEISAKFDQEKVKLNATISWTVNGLTRLQKYYLNHADELDLDKSWINKIIQYRGVQYKLIGLNPKKYKSPISIHNLKTNKSESIDPDLFRRMFRG